MCKECEEETKKVFLESLPKYKNKIDWNKSIGKSVKFIYKSIEGTIEIVNYETKGQVLFVKYKDEPIFKISNSNFIKCKFKGLLKKDILKLIYNENNHRRVDLRNMPLNGNRIDWDKIVKNNIKISFVYEDIRGEIEIIGYNKTKLTIRYLDSEPYDISIESFLKCGLSGILNKRTHDFKIQLDETFKNDKRDIIVINREYRAKIRKDGNTEMQKWYKYHCNKCNYEGWIIEGSLLSGANCSCCSNTIVVEGINDIPTTAPWMVKFFQGGYDEAKLYNRQSNLKIYPICPDCGRVKNKKISISKIYIHHSIGCSCGDGISYPEKFMFNLLEQLLLNNFQYQYQPKWAKPSRYDFYFELNKKKYIIEMDGGLGHGKAIYSKGNKTLQGTIDIDNKKDEMAQRHDNKMIRINCDISNQEYIKNNILNSQLADLFDLNQIDWIKCEEFALSNNVKKICDIKKDCPNLTTGNIAKITKMSQQTIIKYLKQGNVLGWCNYDVKDEKRKNNIKNANIMKKRMSKPVQVFKNGILLGSFESAMELSRQSEQLFGRNLDFRGISQVCLNKRNTYCGYTFNFCIN